MEAHVSGHYRRAQFLRDATWLGLSRDAALSRSELRRRRDQLMIVHHPDLGGDAETAAQINAVYARMSEWVDKQPAARPRMYPLDRDGVGQPASTERVKDAGSLRVWALALAAAATYAVLRGRKV